MGDPAHGKEGREAEARASRVDPPPNPKRLLDNDVVYENILLYYSRVYIEVIGIWNFHEGI